MSVRGFESGSKEERLRKILLYRYNSTANFLDLDGFFSHPETRELRMPYVELGPAICWILKKELSATETILCSNNGLRNLNLFRELPNVLPGLQNLSLKDNLLKTFHDVEFIDGRKFTNLRELILLGNPISDGSNNYVEEITKMFPTLEMLDEKEVPKISFGIPKHRQRASLSV